MPLQDPRKIIVWDIDGPINHHLTANAFVHAPDDRKDPNAEKGKDPADFIINNMASLKLTLDILHRNGVQSVIGSQRIQMEDDDSTYGRYIKAMYSGLKEAFGKNRPYLEEQLARDVGKDLTEEDTQVSKNKLLEAYQKYFKLEPSQVILIDDHKNYKQSAEDAGYGFIHAPRTAARGSVEDNAYLYEALTRTVPIADIYKSIDSAKASKETKNTFKQQLLQFQLDHLRDVAKWQQAFVVQEQKREVKIVDPQEPSWAKKNREVNESRARAEKEPKELQEKVAKEILVGIQYIIMDTNWEIGIFGGERIEDNAGRKNTIPKNMKLILDVIDDAIDNYKPGVWQETLNKVDKIVETAKTQEHGFLNRRGQTSQDFYNRTQKAIKEGMKEVSEEKEAEEGEGEGVRGPGVH